jgi:hypothetical protein
MKKMLPRNKIILLYRTVNPYPSGLDFGVFIAPHAALREAPKGTVMSSLSHGFTCTVPSLASVNDGTDSDVAQHVVQLQLIHSGKKLLANHPARARQHGLW